MLMCFVSLASRFVSENSYDLNGYLSVPHGTRFTLSYKNVVNFCLRWQTKAAELDLDI